MYWRHWRDDWPWMCKWETGRKRSINRNCHGFCGLLDESRLFPTVSVLPRCQVCGSKPSVHRLGQREARPDYVAYCDCEESKTAKHRTADAALREWRITSILRAR